MLYGGVEFLFYQMFVSGAAFSVYKTASVTLLQLQLPQPLFFLLVLFGFDWIFHSLVELPHEVGPVDVYILILLELKHLQILLLICSWASNYVLKLPLNYTVYFLIFHGVKSVLLHAHVTPAVAFFPLRC